MIGKTISHYRIVSQLGLGGMGVVYAADDPRLGRQVALKFVPEELAHDPHALDRLRGEARTASSLNHPNICTIYDIGEYEGRPFIVMELLHGHSLRDRIATRPLKVHEAVDVGIQVADALERAHSRNIIHRDIKPANLFLVDRGPVKVLDFGLAKMLPREFSEETDAETIEHRTAPGVALGTVAYMSPEQVKGDPLDGRTDLFSLGAVLYECLTGQQPFKGKTSAMIFAAILTEAPTAPVALNHDIPLRLQDVINNCLEKDRELRYQDAAGLRAELKRVRRDLESGAARSNPTVAVPSIQARGDSAATTRPETIGDSSASAATTVAITASGSAPTPSVPAAKRRGLVLGAVAVVTIAAAVAIGVAILREPRPSDVGTVAVAPEAVDVDRLFRQASTSVQSRDYRAAQTAIDAVLAAAPTHAGALQLRDQVTAALGRFDDAIRQSQRLLDAGDADGAAKALESARAIDPSAPEVAQISARLVDRFRADASRREASEPPRAAAAAAPRPVPRVAETPPPVVRDQAPPAPPPAPRVDQAPVEAAAPPARPVVEPAATPEPVRPVTPPPAPRVETPSRPALPPTPTVADEDAAIRRVVATYARAIETKDLALFRTVKPNLSAEEQRRLSEGFRAVTSQQVAATVTGIEHRGSDAIVRLTRRDTILAAGRQQTTTTQQTMTLTQSNGAWVIREIGR